MDNWEIKALKYIGKKLDKALDEWLGLFVIVLALFVATMFKVGEPFADWLEGHKAPDVLSPLSALPTLLLSFIS